jgi:hypothetical protein
MEEEKPSSVTSFKRRKEKDEEDEEIDLGLQKIGRRRRRRKQRSFRRVDPCRSHFTLTVIV